MRTKFYHTSQKNMTQLLVPKSQYVIKNLGDDVVDQATHLKGGLLDHFRISFLFILRYMIEHDVYLTSPLKKRDYFWAKNMKSPFFV